MASVLWPLGLALAALPACGSAQPDTTESLGEPSLPLASSADLSASHPILFRRAPLGEGAIGDLYLMPAAGGDAARVTEGGDYTMARWSPDGSSIAYRKRVDGSTTELGLVSPDGADAIALTSPDSGTLIDWPPNWSNDGQLISYASLGDVDSMDVRSVRLWVTTPSGAMQRRLLPNSEALQTEAIWSPDGSRIAYIDTSTLATEQIWLTDALAEAEPQDLTQDRVYAPQMIRWSPDGRYIALAGYALTPDGMIEGFDPKDSSTHMNLDDEIYLLEVETGVLTRLTDNEFVDNSPTWSPDGQSLLVTSDRDGDLDLWLIPIAAADQALNLIDDNADPQNDTRPDWYRGSL